MKLFTPTEIAQIFKVSRKTVYNWINKGMPKETKKPPRFDLEKVKSWLNNRGK